MRKKPLKRNKDQVNNNFNSTFYLFHLLWEVISIKRKKQLTLLLLLMVVGGLSESLSLASLGPFLTIIINPENLFSNSQVENLANYLGIYKAYDLIIPFTIFFILAILTSTSLRVLILWLSSKLTAAITSDLSCEAYNRTINQGYEYHLNKNSNELIAISTTFTVHVIVCIESALKLFTYFILSIGIITTLILINWKIACFTAFFITLIYILISKKTQKILANNSSIIVRESNNQIKALQEGIGGIKEVILNNTQNYYLNIYRKSDIPLRRKMAQNSFLNISPKLIIEGIGISMVASITLILRNSDTNISQIFPIMGTLAFGAQRLLPAGQGFYSSWANIKSRKESLKTLLKIIRQPIRNIVSNNSNQVINFEKKISLKNLSYKFNNSDKLILNKVNLTINKGQTIGIYGTTGSGKSTLIDIIMGLLEPTDGEITIDSLKLYSSQNKYCFIHAWREKISHVPQNIFLADASFKENIAFGMPKEKIDFNLVKKVAKMSLIHDLIINSPNGYETKVGERGSRLSGGQIQRIGIARGLFQNKEILILDEATSALDYDTEKAVINSIMNLKDKLTIIMIAHRLSTLDQCDKLIEVNNGKVTLK